MLAGVSANIGVLAFFLFQMVFMDTAATIPTGSMAERLNFKGFVAMGLWVSMFIYPLDGICGMLGQLSKPPHPPPRPPDGRPAIRALPMGIREIITKTAQRVGSEGLAGPSPLHVFFERRNAR